MTDPWHLVADERRRLADLGDSLTDQQLATPSLCAGWTVHDVLAHLTLSVTPSLTNVLKRAVQARFRPARAVELMTADRAARPTAEVTAELRSRADHRWAPPGFGVVAPLTDLLVHGADIRRPLGFAHDPDPVGVRTALDFVVSPKASRGFTDRRPHAGLRFEAADVPWSSGEGLAVRGPALPLLVALCGRPHALRDLEGDGVPVLRDRLS